MSLPRAFHRPWAYLTVPAIACCAIVAVGVLQGIAILPVDRRSERHGQFEITYNTYDAFGHRGTRKTFHYRGSRRRLLVAHKVGAFRISPHDPHALLYEHCPDSSTAACGIHFFDGRRRRSWKVSNERVLDHPVSAPVSWSVDKRFVVLAGQFHLQIVNLDKPSTITMSDVLALHAGPGWRAVRFGDWSPDVRKIVVLVREYLSPTPPFIDVDEDLVVIDLYDGSATYVATARPRRWEDRNYNWLQTADGYVTYAAPDRQDSDGTIYRKRAADLPNGVSPQPN